MGFLFRVLFYLKTVFLFFVASLFIFFLFCCGSKNKRNKPKKRKKSKGLTLIKKLADEGKVKVV